MKVLEYKPSSFVDHRGHYWTTWKKKKYRKIEFNHDKFSISKKNVLRGLHVDFKSWKLVTCVLGEIFFVVINCNKKSKNYLKSKKWILNHNNKKQILIPPNFANGFLCRSDKCVFHYKFSYKGKYPDVNRQMTLKWNDPKLKIKWPIKKPILSKRDKKAKLL